MPPGVSERDWITLGEKKLSPDEIAQSVTRIIEDVRTRLTEDLSAEKENLPKTCDQASAKNNGTATSDKQIEDGILDPLPSTPRPNELSLFGHDDFIRSPVKRKPSLTGRGSRSPKILKQKKN